jgi:uncharacterized membrane protein YuzA (DUF378 family)
MKMKEQKDLFQYTYSAKEQEEIQKIREKYLPKEENKMDALRKLDQSATKGGSIAALAVGALGALVLGFGMCCTMLWADQFFIPGIFIGIVGLCGVGAAFPLYQCMTKKRREKLAPEILRLTEELTKS